MKEKIFTKLKQAYSSLGLGDEILQAHAESLANLGLVTDVNIDKVIEAQKSFLENLQKSNDKRVTDATAKAKQKAKEEFEEEAKKKAEEEARKQAEAEAKKKAEEEAKKKKAEEEARKKAEEEAERKRKEEMEKNDQIPDAVKKILEERDNAAKAEREKYEALIKSLTEKSQKAETDFASYVQETNEKTKKLLDGYEAMKKEAEEAKAESKKRARKDFILSKAKELQIPQYRIDEGFNIGEDMDEGAISEFLAKVSNNIKANSLPKDNHFRLDDNTKPDKEEVDAVAKSLVKNLI